MGNSVVRKIAWLGQSIRRNEHLLWTLRLFAKLPTEKLPLDLAKSLQAHSGCQTVTAGFPTALTDAAQQMW